jgi:ferric-dicitrate binding protein FerR (iron transport regulator)
MMVPCLALPKDVVMSRFGPVIRATLLSVCCLTWPAAAATGGTVVAIEGQVQARTAAQSQWAMARLRQPYRAGDALRTGRNARAEIAMADGTVTRLAPHSLMRFQDKQSFGRLLLGRLWFKVSKQHAPIRIETPSAVTAVVGTELLVSVDSQGSTHVTCLEGRVQVRGDVGPEVTLLPGQWTDVRKGAAAEPPTPFNWARLKATEILLQPLQPGVTGASDEADPDDIWK